MVLFFLLFIFDQKLSILYLNIENMKTAVLGGGCFWCIEAIFQRFIGVASVRSGYAGGKSLNPTYY